MNLKRDRYNVGLDQSRLSATVCVTVIGNKYRLLTTRIAVVPTAVGQIQMEIYGRAMQRTNYSYIFHKSRPPITLSAFIVHVTFIVFGDTTDVILKLSQSDISTGEFVYVWGGGDES